MRSSTDLILAPEAADDLDDMYAYTRDTWGGQQADRYHNVIRDAFLRLQTFPEIGRVTDDDPRVREYTVREHLVLYRYDADANVVTILRIVNPRRLRR